MKKLNMVSLSLAYYLDIESVGKKAFELGKLKYLKIPIPNGFVITNYFFEDFLKTTGISKDLEEIKKINHPSLKHSFEKLYEPLQKRIAKTHIPGDLASDLHKFYRDLTGHFKEISVDILSSSMTNKIVSFLDTKGDANIVVKIKKILALNLENPPAVVILENFKQKKKKTFTDGPIADSKLTKNQSQQLINYCKAIKNHFYFPKEIEYVVRNGKIIITQINPFTGTINAAKKQINSSNINIQHKTLLKGTTVNPGIVTGPVKILTNFQVKTKVNKGEIVIVPYLNPSFYKKIKDAKAVVIDSILTNSFDKATYKKNYKIPTIEGTINAGKVFRNGSIVTVNGIRGEMFSGFLTS